MRPKINQLLGILGTAMAPYSLGTGLSLRPFRNGNFKYQSYNQKPFSHFLFFFFSIQTTGNQNVLLSDKLS